MEAEVVFSDRFHDDFEALAVPVLFLHGEADPFVRAATTEADVDKMPASEERKKIYPGARHEPVSEANEDEAMAKSVSFAEDVTP